MDDLKSGVVAQIAAVGPVAGAALARAIMPSVPGSTETLWSAVLWQPGVRSWRLVGTEGDRDHALSEAADWKRDLHDGERIAIAFQTRSPWHVRTAGPR